jgi:hypothetical protein
VDHIIRGHDQPDIGIRRYVDFIDPTGAVGLLDLPHPLLGFDVNFKIRSWLLEGAELGSRHPPENEQERECGCACPADLDFAMYAGREGLTACWRAAPVTYRKHDGEDEYEGGDQARQ